LGHESEHTKVQKNITLSVDAPFRPYCPPTTYLVDSIITVYANDSANVMHSSAALPDDDVGRTKKIEMR
jgi:hypothetical protein